MVPTKPFAKAPGPRFAQLGATRVLDLVEASRNAALAFLEGTATGWGRRELGAWLVGPYRAAARHAAARASGGSGQVVVSDSGVERVLLRTRERLIDLLSGGTQEWSAAAFARHAVDAGLVLGVTDVYGALGYAPAEVAGMRLYDRVASLFVADYLTRPRDYDGMTMCEECAEITFPWADAHHRYCSNPPLESGVVLARGALAPPTFSGLGARA